LETTSITSLHNSFELPPLLVKKYKIGIYKELCKKGLLTTEQLDALIELQKIEANFQLSQN